MKKRITISLLLLAALTVLSVSCQRNEITAGDGTTKDVSISIALPSGLLVKSQDNPGDGSMVNRCILEIYEDGVLYGERLYADISSLSASFMTRLTTGKTYTFVLWADCADGNAADGFSDIYYNTADGLTSITVNPEAYTNNNDGLDAFYGTFSQQVDNTSELSFTLKRPFGQLNIITLDAATAGIDIADVEARVSFSEVPAGFNALEGTVSADRIQITPAVFSPSVNMATEGTEPGEETQLTFDYLFASQETEETLINFTLELQSNGQAICPPYDASNIPMVRNHKTNVKSDFITSGIEIVVDIDPMFDDNGEEPAPEPVEVTAIEGSVDYYGTANGTTNANYVLTLNDGMGQSFTLDLYGAEGTALPAGTYQFSSTEDQANTFFSGNSGITEWGMEIGTFTSGTLTVNLSGTQYDVSLEAETEEGEAYHVTFYGNISFNDLTVPPTGFESDLVIENANVFVSYEGVKGSKYNMTVEINDFNNTGYNVYLNLIAEMNSEGELAEGTYTVGSGNELYTVLKDNSYARFTDTETYIAYDAPLTSGSVEITGTNIQGEVYVQGGHKVTFSTAGLPSYVDLGRFPTAGSNVSGNVDLTYDGDVNAYANAYKDYWHITIAPTYVNDGPALNLDLATGASYETGFGGTYTCSNSGDAYTFLPGTAYINGTNCDYWGMVYYDCAGAVYAGTYATISSGTITITENSREVINEWGDEQCNCTIVLNGLDPAGNEIKVTYNNINFNLSKNTGSDYYNF